MHGNVSHSSLAVAPSTATAAAVTSFTAATTAAAATSFTAATDAAAASSGFHPRVLLSYQSSPSVRREGET